MTEKWTWLGEPHNIHIVQADAPHMRVCFMTSDGPTEERANLIAAAPDMYNALRAGFDCLAKRAKPEDQIILRQMHEALSKALGKEADNG